MQKYTCLMHPEVISDHPGNCPKCGMKLVPVKQNKRPTLNSQRPIISRIFRMRRTKCTRLRMGAMKCRWKCTPLSISRIR
jgi:hypothetical protein